MGDMEAESERKGKGRAEGETAGSQRQEGESSTQGQQDRGWPEWEKVAGQQGRQRGNRRPKRRVHEARRR